MKELRLEMALRTDGSQEHETLVSGVIIKFMEIRREFLMSDFRGMLTEFNITMDSVDEDTYVEIVCPLCEKAIPQLTYRKISKGDQI